MPKQNRISIFMLLLLGAAAFSSCENKEPINCVLPATTVSSNSPVILGGTIQLVTPGSENMTFEWTGPNGFVSNQQNPIITNVTAAMAGEYKVKIVDGICKSPESVVNIEIVPNPIDCTQQNNSVTIANSGTYNFSYAFVKGSPYLEFNAYGNQASVSINFGIGANELPVEGIYTVCNDCEVFELGISRVNLTASTLADEYLEATSGQIVVSYVNGDLSVAFCNVPFQNNSGDVKNISARFSGN